MMNDERKMFRHALIPEFVARSLKRSRVPSAFVIPSFIIPSFLPPHNQHTPDYSQPEQCGAEQSAERAAEAAAGDEDAKEDGPPPHAEAKGHDDD